MFDRPSINLGRIEGGDALNKVPDRCEMAVDVRFLPGQDPGEILEQVRSIPGIDVKRTFIYPPVAVSPSDPYVRALRDACRVRCPTARRSASDGTAPPTWPRSSRRGSWRSSSVPPDPATTAPTNGCRSSSLVRYRRALGDFVRSLPARLEQPDSGGGLTAIEGGLA